MYSNIPFPIIFLLKNYLPHINCIAIPNTFKRHLIMRIGGKLNNENWRQATNEEMRPIKVIKHGR